MLIEKRNFLQGMNGDTDPKLLQDSEMLNLMNGRVAVTEFGRYGRVENIPGTTLISQAVYPPYGTQQCIGGCYDSENGWIVYFMWNSFDDHGIYCYDIATGITYPVLYDSQTTDGLGFSKNFRIDRNCHIINSVLYWTDYNAQPRKINVKRGINLNRPGTFAGIDGYTGGIDENIITIIRKPPNYFLSINKVEQTSPVVNTNFITLFAGKFSAFYDFVDNEKSVLTGYSPLANYNFKADTYNAIDVSFSFGEIIPQDVQRIQVAVQFGRDPNFFTVKIWDKANAIDAAEIAAHNAGSTALTYRFFNDQTGIPLDSAFSVKPYDSVPLKSKTIETIKNRLFLGNNTEGYTSPTITSLTAAFSTQSSGTSLTGNVFKLIISDGRIRYVIQLPVTVSTLAGYYRVTADDTTLPVGTIAYSALTFISASETDVFKHYIPSWPIPPPSVTSFTAISTVSISGVTNPLINQSAYKSGAPYKAGIWFFDRWMRKCGVVINGITYVTADRQYTIASYTVSLDWTLSNANAVNEIPDWAEFYVVGRTKCLRTNYFLQVRSKNTVSSMTYVTKDAANQYAFATSAYSDTLAGVGIDITNLTQFGMGYAFSEGDLIKIYISTSVYNLRILAQDGRWLICELQNLGTLNSSTDALFEIYTPYTPSINEAYYEMGNIYAINNPGQSNREYSILSGSIDGDITLLSRGTSPNDYITENMSPNDTYWMNWFTDAGRPNFIDTIGQKVKKNNISFSNTYIPGSNINGLSSFDALDEKSTPQESGELNKLQAANKVTEEGNIMLAIHTTETISCYMGEVQLVGQAQNAFIAQAPEVIGTMNALRGSYGTVNPETVIPYLGLVFWLDALNGCFVQYSQSGLEPISRYKMSRFFKNYCKDYLASNSNNLDNINGFHHIPTCIDPFHKEIIVSLPGLIYQNYADTLPSYTSVPSYATSIINRFNIYDELAKTMSFQYEENKWGSDYEFMGEFYVNAQNQMFGWKNGYMYSHNTNVANWNTFYGVQYPVRICFTGNLNPSAMKDLFNIAVESNVAPDYSVVMANYPNEQITDLASGDYTDQEGIFYSVFFRDRLSPNVTGTADAKMYKGDILKDYAFFVMLEFQAYGSLIFINFVDIGYQISRGQKQILNTVNG